MSRLTCTSGFPSTQNPFSDPTVSGTGDFGGMENTVGARVDWDLNRVVFSLGYDHYNFISTSSGVSQSLQRGPGPIPSCRTCRIAPPSWFMAAWVRSSRRRSTTGVEAGGSFTDYSSEFFHDNLQFSVGPFIEMQVSRDLRARAAGGYVRSDFEEEGISSAPSSVDDFYAQISLDHQLSQYVDHRLALGREATSGAEAELITYWYARYENNWRFSQYATLNTSLLYENGRERSGVAEKLWRAGGSLGVTVPLSRQLSTRVQYHLIYKNSNKANRDYLQNVIGIELHYVF